MRLVLVLPLLALLWVAPLVTAQKAMAGDLVKAAKEGNLTAVTTLLAEGADPDQFDRNRNTALIFAARDGHLEMAKRLLAAGASVNWVDGEKVTPLILAAFKNHPPLVRLFLAQGADPSPRDKWGRQALDYALRRGEEDEIAQMIKAVQQDP